MTQPAPIFTPGDRVRVTASGAHRGKRGTVVEMSPSTQKRRLDGQWRYLIDLDASEQMYWAENHLSPA